MYKKICLELFLIFSLLIWGAISAHAEITAEEDTVRIASVSVDANSSVVVDVELITTKNLAALTVPITFRTASGDTLNIDADSIVWSDWVMSNPPDYYTRDDDTATYVDSVEKTVIVYAGWPGFDDHLAAGSGSIFTIYFTTHEFWGGGVAVLDTFSTQLPSRELLIVDAFYVSSIPTFVPGSISPTWVKEIDTGNSGLPEKFALNQNYPNPFNSATVIRFALPQDSWVKVEVFNILGQKITTLVDEHLTAGYKETGWEGTDSKGNHVASGIYFFKINARNFTDIKKMVLLK